MPGALMADRDVLRALLTVVGDLDREQCWTWRGVITRRGYGAISGRLAHRVVYELLVGTIPDGLQLDHLCHTEDRACAGGDSCLHRRCVNPDHMEPVTQAENTRRGLGFAGCKSRQTHCVNGHELNEANVYLSKLNQRRCRLCHRDAMRLVRARRREVSA